MAVHNKKSFSPQPVNEAIAATLRNSAFAAQWATELLQSATKNSTAVAEEAKRNTQKLVEQGTETVGHMVTPIAENPLVKYVSKVPGVSWLMTALGQVDQVKAQQEVDQLRQKYPYETPEQLATRIVTDTAVKAGGIGLFTNIVPPLALALFAVDIAAVTTLQAEMVYRIAAAYGFPLHEPARRGEVLAIFGLSVGGSGTLKSGLSFIELIPGFGALVGASSNAALIYTLGHLASQFYAEKRQAAL